MISREKGENNTMKVWITKYALTKGILQKETDDFCLDTDSTGNMICINENGYRQCFHGKGDEWHDNKQSAIIKAETMRKKKISNLQKQIKKLENIIFE